MKKYLMQKISIKQIIHDLKIPFVLSGVSITGVLLNLSTRIINHGMPVLGLEEEFDKWIPMTSNTRLNFFSDWIPIPDGRMSIGDILMIITLVGYVIWITLFLLNGIKQYKNNSN
jgi:hypothetical protein